MNLSLSPAEERVLGLLLDRSALDVEQIAGIGLLSIDTAVHALDSLLRAHLVTSRSRGDEMQIYELNRQVAKNLTAAA
jgi:DNA-binding transcriptional ArsR family regulator